MFRVNERANRAYISKDCCADMAVAAGVRKRT
jgi:hypothetical protein